MSDGAFLMSKNDSMVTASTQAAFTLKPALRDTFSMMPVNIEGMPIRETLPARTVMLMATFLRFSNQLARAMQTGMLVPSPLPKPSSTPHIKNSQKASAKPKRKKLAKHKSDANSIPVLMEKNL